MYASYDEWHSKTLVDDHRLPPFSNTNRLSLTVIKEIGISKKDESQKRNTPTRASEAHPLIFPKCG